MTDKKKTEKKGEDDSPSAAVCYAATQWFKFNPDPKMRMFQPDKFEWCLWTMEINGQVNYFSGHWFEMDGEIRIQWQGYADFPLNETAQWARVKKLQA